VPVLLCALLVVAWQFAAQQDMLHAATPQRHLLQHHRDAKLTLTAAFDCKSALSQHKQAWQPRRPDSGQAKSINHDGGRTHECEQEGPSIMPCASTAGLTYAWCLHFALLLLTTHS